jgi:hypothetical protein
MFLITVISLASIASEPEQHHHENSDDSLLSPEIRPLFVQEMNELKKGMELLSFAVASGDWGTIQDTGNSIRDSYILKKKLSNTQMHELHETLPAAFQELDAKFHYYAAMLSHVAVEKDIELVNYYVYKMNEVCVSCHSTFAANRFSGFKQKNRHAEHRH